MFTTPSPNIDPNVKDEEVNITVEEDFVMVNKPSSTATNQGLHIFFGTHML